MHNFLDFPNAFLFYLQIFQIQSFFQTFIFKNFGAQYLTICLYKFWRSIFDHLFLWILALNLWPFQNFGAKIDPHLWRQCLPVIHLDAKRKNARATNDQPMRKTRLHHQQEHKYPSQTLIPQPSVTHLESQRSSKLSLSTQSIENVWTW